jgi:ribosomal protein S10|tara:strand:+ start:2408 stop:2563 length:156 start_codon:yes stop_codon:yes gene_type:complete
VRNLVVREQIKNPKRNSGKHKDKREQYEKRLNSRAIALAFIEAEKKRKEKV